MQAKLDTISPVLATLGVPSGAGKLTWYQELPIIMAVEDYNTFTYTPLGEDKVGDFVIHTEIVWDSTSGLAGCGVIMRSDGNLDTGKHIEFDLMRLQNAPAWEMYYVKYHWIEKYLTRYKFDTGINDGKDSQNTVDLLVQGKQFSTYINGDKKQDTENGDLSDGYIYVITHQESGLTFCTFKNSWVWSLDESNQD